MYTVDDMDKCNRFLAKLHINGWRLWQMQYDRDSVEGFHAWWWKHGEEDIELVTHSREAQEAIIAYK